MELDLRELYRLLTTVYWCDSILIPARKIYGALERMSIEPAQHEPTIRSLVARGYLGERDLGELTRGKVQGKGYSLAPKGLLLIAEKPKQGVLPK